MMIRIVKHRYAYYKRFEYDIWGMTLVTSRDYKPLYYPDKLSSNFFYRMPGLFWLVFLRRLLYEMKLKEEEVSDLVTKDENLIKTKEFLSFLAKLKYMSNRRLLKYFLVESKYIFLKKYLVSYYNFLLAYERNIMINYDKYRNKLYVTQKKAFINSLAVKHFFFKRLVGKRSGLSHRDKLVNLVRKIWEYNIDIMSGGVLYSVRKNKDIDFMDLLENVFKEEIFERNHSKKGNKNVYFDEVPLRRRIWQGRFFHFLYYKREMRNLQRYRRYVYTVHIVNPEERKKIYKARFLSIRLTRLFFLTFKDYQFRQLFKKVKRLDGNMETNYCHFIEGRLLSIIYRTNFIRDMFEVIRLIKDGKVFVNYKCINLLNYRVPVSAFITVEPIFLPLLRLKLRQRLLRQNVAFNVPKYLFVSYQLFFAFMLRQPILSDISYPIYLDIYRLTGYF